MSNTAALEGRPGAGSARMEKEVAATDGSRHNPAEPTQDAAAAEPPATSDFHSFDTEDLREASSSPIFPPFRFLPIDPLFNLRPGGFRIGLDEEARKPTQTEIVLVQLLNQEVETCPRPIAEQGSIFRARSNTINQKLIDDLNQIARCFLTGSWDPPTCLEKLQLALAENKQQLVQLEWDRNFHVEIRKDDQGLPVDLDVGLGEVQLLQEQAELVIEVKKALTVISVVFAGRSADDKQRRRQGEYVVKLHDILFAGLSSTTGTAHSLRALEAFHDEFVSREASAVKNHYVRKLGLRAAISAALFMSFHIVASHPATGLLASSAPLIAPHLGNLLGPPVAQLLLLGVGASIGTWLSFSLRRPVLGFADLAVLEEDRLNPTARILFVLGLTLVVGLLIYTKLVAIKVGDIDVDLRMALLLGLLCGIAERALAGAVSQRAREVVERVGGSPSVPPTQMAAQSS